MVGVNFYFAKKCYFPVLFHCQFDWALHNSAKVKLPHPYLLLDLPSSQILF